MESLFVWGHLDTFVEIELAFVASIVNMQIFCDDVSQLESLSIQLIFAWVVWLLLCMFMIDSCVAAFETSYLNRLTWISLEEKQKFKLGVLMSHQIWLI